MPAKRQRGMDHDLYPYVPLPARKPWRLPDGASVAMWVCLHLEYWELDPPGDALRPPGIDGAWQTHPPDYRTFAHREYGNRIGVFRVLDALDEFGFRPTVAANAEVCRRYPALLFECIARGAEVAAGGTHATRMISSQYERGRRTRISQSRRWPSRTSPATIPWVGSARTATSPSGPLESLRRRDSSILRTGRTTTSLIG